MRDGGRARGAASAHSPMKNSLAMSALHTKTKEPALRDRPGIAALPASKNSETLSCIVITIPPSTF